MKRSLFYPALAILILGVSACKPETETETEDTSFSDSSDSAKNFSEYRKQNNKSGKLLDSILKGKTSSETENLPYEPVIVFADEDSEFDITNMTYRDFIEFFEDLGLPAMDVEKRQFSLPAYAEDCEMDVFFENYQLYLSLETYNPTDQTISLMDAKVQYIKGLDDLIPGLSERGYTSILDHLTFCGFSLYDAYDIEGESFLSYLSEPYIVNGAYLSGAQEKAFQEKREVFLQKAAELGYRGIEENYVLEKTLPDGRIIRIDDRGLEITPLLDETANP